MEMGRQLVEQLIQELVEMVFGKVGRMAWG